MCIKFLSSPSVICLVFLTIKFGLSEWVEIPQAGEKKNYKLSETTSAVPLSSILDRDQIGSLVTAVVLQPNKAWLDYQKERFEWIPKSTVPSAVISGVNRIVVKDSIDRVDYWRGNRTQNFENKVPLKVYDTIHLNDEQYDDPDPVGESKPNRSKVGTTDNKISSFTDEYQNNSPEGDETDGSQEQAPFEIPSKSSFESNESGESQQPDDIEISPFQKFLNYVKNIRSKFVSTTSKGIEDKIKYLNTFKDDLMYEIMDRLTTLFPSAASSQKGRRKRETMRLKRAALLEDTFMSFPSTEGALMTINFLTFAVFLIKLVLQVINTVKSKHYAYNGFTVNTMEAIKVGKTRKARSPENSFNFKNDVDKDLEAERILKSIDSFRTKLNLS